MSEVSSILGLPYRLCEVGLSLLVAPSVLFARVCVPNPRTRALAFSSAGRSLLTCNGQYNMLHVMKYISKVWVSAQSTSMRIAHSREADTVDLLHVTSIWQSTGTG